MLKHIFVAPFPRTKRSFGARGALIRFIVAVVALDFVESRQREHSSSCCSNSVARRSWITRTDAFRMTVRAAGGRRTGCATPSRCEQQQQQQHSSSQASIGAIVGCDRVSCGVVRDSVGFKNFFDCVRMPDLVSDREPPFPIHRSELHKSWP